MDFKEVYESLGNVKKEFEELESKLREKKAIYDKVRLERNSKKKEMHELKNILQDLIYTNNVTKLYKAGDEVIIDPEFTEGKGIIHLTHIPYPFDVGTVPIIEKMNEKTARIKLISSGKEKSVTISHLSLGKFIKEYSPSLAKKVERDQVLSSIFEE